MYYLMKAVENLSFENTSNSFTSPIITKLNKENLTHSADSLILMFSSSDQSSKNSNADMDFKTLISTVPANTLTYLNWMTL